MSDAEQVGPDEEAGTSDDPSMESVDPSEPTRWTQRSGWIADSTQPDEPTPIISPPPTRPVRTRSRIVAAATGDETEAIGASGGDPSPSVDLTVPEPPQLPPPLVRSGQRAEPDLIDLRSEEVRSLLQDGAGGAVTNGPSRTTDVPTPTEGPSKWGAARRVAPAVDALTTVIHPAPPAEVDDGPSLVTLSDATDPGLLITPVATTDDAEPAVDLEDPPEMPIAHAEVPDPAGTTDAALEAGGEAGGETVASIDQDGHSEAAALEPMAAAGDVFGSNPPAEPTPEEGLPRFGMAPVSDLGGPSNAVAGADAPPAQTPTRSLAPEPSVGAGDDGRRSRVFTSGLFVVALALAVAAGILGALWQRERSTNDDLRAELAAASEVDAADQQMVDELVEANRTLELQNAELTREVGELRSYVPPVPEGRITEIDVPFVPYLVDESGGRLIAVDPVGEYVVLDTGVDGGITDSGRVAGAPTSLFAHRDNGWVATQDGGIEVISLVDGSDVLAIATAEVSLMVPSSRTIWSYVPGSRELRRHRETNGNVRATVTLPVEIRELSLGAGAVWALGEDGLVYRVNTADLTVSPIPAGQEVISISAGTDALWALSAADGSLRRVDAVSGDVLVTVPVGRDPIAVEFSGSSVWVALRSGETLIEVDTRTAAVVSRTSLTGVPLDVTAGSSGVLVTLEGDVPLVRVASFEDGATAALEAAEAEAEAEAEGDPADG